MSSAQQSKKKGFFSCCGGDEVKEEALVEVNERPIPVKTYGISAFSQLHTCLRSRW